MKLMIDNKYKHRLPPCTNELVQSVLTCINELSPTDRKSALKFVQMITPRGLCELLFSIRQWYKSWHISHQKRILKYHNALSTVMDLSLPVGAYRGIRIPRNSQYAKIFSSKSLKESSA